MYIYKRKTLQHVHLSIYTKEFLHRSFPSLPTIFTRIPIISLREKKKDEEERYTTIGRCVLLIKKNQSKSGRCVVTKKDEQKNNNMGFNNEILPKHQDLIQKSLYQIHHKHNMCLGWFAWLCLVRLKTAASGYK